MKSQNNINSKSRGSRTCTDEKKIEVEIKVAILEEKVANIKRKLKEMGFFSSKMKLEEDIYFTSNFRDFIKTRECLRVRIRENFAEMTYKGKTTEDMLNSCQFWKKEYNLTIDKRLVNNAVDFLKALGFIEAVKVVKKRQEFKLGSKTVAIDEVKNGGYFVEIESMALENNKDKAMADNRKIMALLGIEDCQPVDEPYRDIVMRNTGK
jgi:adenylate cyclase class 2